MEYSRQTTRIQDGDSLTQMIGEMPNSVVKSGVFPVQLSCMR
jgi:hypothetical protein